MLAPEWKRKNVLPALKHLYDELWIYGLPQFNDPLSGITLPKSVRRKTVYTGYLRRDLPRESDDLAVLHDLNRPYILVTAGGGGDGESVVDWVLRAYEHDANIPYAVIVVFGTLVVFASHAPGGIGALDAAMLLGLPSFDRAELVATLLLYRLLYFVVPFAIALAGLGLREAYVHFHE